MGNTCTDHTTKYIEVDGVVKFCLFVFYIRKGDHRIPPLMKQR